MSKAPKTTRRQRPSEELPILRSQLRQALEELRDDDDGPGARDYRRFVRRAMARAWRAAMAGEAEVVAEVIEIFREARPMVDDALPLLEPRAGAAVEMQQMLSVLYVGEGELRWRGFSTRGFVKLHAQDAGAESPVLEGLPLRWLSRADRRAVQRAVAHVEDDCLACGLCGEMAQAAVLCPSFYRATRIRNAGPWERLLHRLRRRVIGVLQEAL